MDSFKKNLKNKKKKGIKLKKFMSYRNSKTK